MKLHTLSRVLNVLLVYFVCLLLVVGLFGKDIVNNLLQIALFYGFPLFALIVLYIARMAVELRTYIKIKECNFVLVGTISIKMAIATIPMFFLDNSMASLLVRMRLA